MEEEMQIEGMKNGKPFIGTPQQWVDELTYASYRQTRLSNPDDAPESWRVIYGSRIPALEARFQQDQQAY